MIQNPDGSTLFHTKSFCILSPSVESSFVCFSLLFSLRRFVLLVVFCSLSIYFSGRNYFHTMNFDLESANVIKHAKPLL